MQNVLRVTRATQEHNKKNTSEEKYVTCTLA